MSLLGLAGSPIPRTARQFFFGQGSSTGASGSREVVIVANKTSAGTLAVETLSDYVTSQTDVDTLTGARSEARWMYFAFNLGNQTARVRIMLIAENASATASTVTFTFVTAADDATDLRIDWGGLRTSVPVAAGELAVNQAANAQAAIAADLNLPFTAAVGGVGSEHILTVTTAPKGPRSAHILGALRFTHAKSVATVITKSAVSAGTGADDNTLALAALESAEIYYHAAACTASSGVTTTDSSVGEYIQYIRTQNQPVNAKDQIVVFGLDCSASAATSVATSAAANSVFAKFPWVQNNDWFPGMIAAHYCGILQLQEDVYAGFNFADYTNTDSTPFAIPDPIAKGDRPTTTEITTALNNGFIPIGFRSNGQSYVVRDITSSNFSGSSTTKDYRARPGHIPSVIFAFWAELRQRHLASKQPNIAADPPAGVRPEPGFTYPGAVASRIRALIADFSTSNNFAHQDGKALLDPSVIDEMNASVSVVALAAGFEASATPQPVRHDYFDDFKINQAGPAY